jgi:Arc/MetJ-type ribon-helix-helix transcriptional regulator
MEIRTPPGHSAGGLSTPPMNITPNRPESQIRVPGIRKVASHVQSRCVLRTCRLRNTIQEMKTLTVRLPEALVAEIEAESRLRRLSKSDVVRERLSLARRASRRRCAPLDAISDLIGSVDGLPADLSARKKHYIRKTGYGQKRGR